MNRPACIAALVLAVGACGGDDGEDSAGPSGAGYAIEPTPYLSVGVLEGDTLELFHQVVDPFLLPNGHLAVPTSGSGTVRFFDSDGAFVRSLGGPGEGPGEFTSLRNAWARGDTIEVWDDRALRITRFLPDGQLDIVGIPSGRVDAGIGPLGAGWVLMSLRIGRDGRDLMGGELFERSGQHAGTLSELEGMTRHATPMGTGPHPVTQTALLEVHGGELYAAETQRPLIRVYDVAGELRREIPLGVGQPAPAGEVFQQVVDSAVARVDPDQAAATRQRLSAYPEPESVPLFWALLVDAEGLVWVRPYDPFRHSLALGGSPAGRGGPGGEWIVVARDGTEVARVEMPPGLEPVRVTSTAVVGIHRDELGVESVRVHALMRGAS